jgi:thiaminase/transcriptional activator TenA
MAAVKIVPGGASTLTAELWQAATPIYQRILGHPFLSGLTDGSLPRAAFAFYVVQDAHYLRHYARTLSVLATRAPSAPATLMFNQHAATAILVERQLHEGFFEDLGLSAGQAAGATVAPVNLAYCSYLLSVAQTESFAEGLGAVLPCYWIYWEVGKALARAGSPDPLCQRWIDTYASDEFAAVVGQVLELTDEVGERLDDVDRQRVAERFLTACRYEWMFWDAAYRQESWPV